MSPMAFNEAPDRRSDGGFSLPPGRSRDICIRLQAAIIEHRLRPGMKLSEDEVGEIFSAGRTVVRTALQALAHTGLVEIRRNRGAFVAQPTVRHAEEVFEARALIEPEIAERAALKANAADLKRLNDHIAAEHDALRAGDMGQALALSGRFHITIAQIADHALYTQIIQSLITQSSLIIALYWKRSDATCESHSHDALVDALAKKDGARARAIMRSHMIDLYSGLDLGSAVQPELSLAASLADH